MVVELSDYVPINFICLAVLGALGLRRLVRMERWHGARVVILTGLLWVPTIYLCLLCCCPELSESPCEPLHDESCASTIYE
jgi:hypothetical protein